MMENKDTLCSDQQPATFVDEQIWTCASLTVTSREYSCLLSPTREASAIQAEKLHTDDINLPRIQVSLLIGYRGQIRLLTQYLKTLTVNSWLMLSATLTQTKITMLVIEEME